jgi:hypothetical protein
MTNAAKS